MFFFACKTEKDESKREYPHLEFEQSVIYEIFPSLMDSLHNDYRAFPPPPPVAIYDKNGNYIGVDSVKTKKRIKEFKLRQAKFKADSTKLIIAVKDSTYSLGRGDKQSLLKHYEAFHLKLDTISVSGNYKIEINQLKADKKLKFKYRSEFPDGIAIWKEKYDFHLNEVTGFSRIQFDSTKSFGVLRSGMGCGKLCGVGVRVFIKKQNGKWVIDDIVVVEIS